MTLGMNIVIPMAGWGSRFQKVGYSLPKPLIEIHGKSMIEWVIQNLRPKNRNYSHRFVFICRDEHLRDFGLKERLLSLAPGSEIISVNKVTEGAACTVLLAQQYIDNEQPLMIANCDQWIDFPIDLYLDAMEAHSWDGLIMTMKASSPKWSYVRLDPQGEITEVVEKKVVSDEATVGIYNFRKGSDFVWAAQKMIEKNLRVNGEFYVAPTYNQLLAVGKKIGYHNIGSDLTGMYGLGTPEDLERFIQLPISKRS